MKNLWAKWTILVWANAILGLWLGSGFLLKDISQMAGMVLGVCLFIPLYVRTELHIRQKNNPKLLKAMTVAVVLRFMSQLGVYVDFGAGMIALMFLEKLGIKEGFWMALLATIITGGLLSLVVAMLTAIVMGISSVMNSYSHAKQGS